MRHLNYISTVEINSEYARLNPRNCAVRERTGDSVSVGVCSFYLVDGTTCPRHGQVKELTREPKPQVEPSSPPRTSRWAKAWIVFKKLVRLIPIWCAEPACWRIKRKYGLCRRCWADGIWLTWRSMWGDDPAGYAPAPNQAKTKGKPRTRTKKAKHAKKSTQ